MRRGTHLSGYGRLHSFRNITLPHETKARSFKDLPSTSKTLQDVPGPKGIYNLPIVGSALEMYPYMKNRDSHLYFLELYKKYGTMVRIRLGPQNCLILFDPELISQTIAHEGIYPERFPVPIMDSYAKRTHRCMLSQQNGPEWQSYRSAAQQSIKPNVIKHYVESQAHCAEDLVTWIGIHGNNNPKVKDAFRRFSADANSVVTFDKKMGFLESLEKPDPELEHFLRSIQQFMDSIGESIFSLSWYKFWRTKTYTEFENATETVYRISGKSIDAVRHELESQERESYTDESNLTVLKLLLRDERITNEIVTNLMAAFVFAGIEQVSQFLMWMFWLLGKSPEKQEKLYQEIVTNVGSSALTASHLEHLPYLKACVKESFRCVPPVACGIARILPQDTEIGGYLIPKRTTVFFGNNTLSRAGELFEDPDQFLPERWLDGTNDPQTQRLMGLCVLPFGMGKRNCLGRRFAEQEIHLATIKVLQNFKVEITEDCQNVRPKYTLFAEPDTPIKFNFTRRPC